jgi:hypothetical protein
MNQSAGARFPKAPEHLGQLVLATAIQREKSNGQPKIQSREQSKQLWNCRKLWGSDTAIDSGHLPMPRQ